MGGNKLKRFEDNLQFQNVLQPTREELISGTFLHKGSWGNFFQNDHPIVLELGCGKGEYTVSLAEEEPEKNYIGIDIKGARFWRGAKDAIAKNLTNVAFIRMDIGLILHAFEKNEVSEIWITFPDPQIKYKRTKHRLTNVHFLSKYKEILKPSGLIHLKTDSEFMHGYTLGLLHGLGYTVDYSNHNIYNTQQDLGVVHSVQTFYEKQYLEEQKPITYLRFLLEKSSS